MQSKVAGKSGLGPLNFAASGGTGHLTPPGPLSGDKYSYSLLPQPHCGWKSIGHDPPPWIGETFSDWLLNNKKREPTVRDPPSPSGKQASSLLIEQAHARGKSQLNRWTERTQHTLPSAKSGANEEPLSGVFLPQCKHGGQKTQQKAPPPGHPLWVGQGSLPPHCIKRT